MHRPPLSLYIGRLAPLSRLPSNTSVHLYESPERPILRQISSLMCPKIQRRRVIVDVLRSSCARPPRWSPPVLWKRFEDGLASVLIHSCRIPKVSETTGFDDGWKWWLGGNATDVSTTGREKLPSCVLERRQDKFILRYTCFCQFYNKL